MSDELQHQDTPSTDSNATDNQTVRMPLPATDASGKGAASSNAGGAHFSTANSDADADEATQQAMQSLLAHRKKRRVKRIIGAAPQEAPRQAHHRCRCCSACGVRYCLYAI